MTVPGTGVVAGDFTQLLNDWGQTVSYSVVTKTTDPENGQESSSFASASNQSVIFFYQDKKFQWDPEGLIQLGDAYIIAPTTLGAKRYDQFTSPDGDVFYIEKVVRRYVAGVLMSDFCTCFKVG